MNNFFVTGTDTNVGKTTVSKWLCYHLNLMYFKPIQTGIHLGIDRSAVEIFTNKKMHPSIYEYIAPLSPLHASIIENTICDVTKIQIPQNENLLIEGAGGVLVPIFDKFCVADLIKKLDLPAIVVARTTLGTLNHTLLTIEALKARQIPILGVIMSGPQNDMNRLTIEQVSQIEVLDLLEFQSDEDLKKKKPSQKLLQKLDRYAIR